MHQIHPHSGVPVPQLHTPGPLQSSSQACPPQQNMHQMHSNPAVPMGSPGTLPSSEVHPTMPVHQIPQLQPVQLQGIQHVSPVQPHGINVPTTNNSSVNNSPTVPIEQICDSGQKLYKIVGKDGKVHVFRAALDESTSAADVTNASQEIKVTNNIDNSHQGTTVQQKPVVNQIPEGTV